MKYLKVTMSDRTVWVIPADIIAKVRAAYFAKEFECVAESTEPRHNDLCEGTYPEIYVREYDYTMDDEDEIIIWAQNNMNWKDVERYARKISNGAAVDYNEDWTNSDMDVVEMDE